MRTEKTASIVEFIFSLVVAYTNIAVMFGALVISINGHKRGGT